MFICTWRSSNNFMSGYQATQKLFVYLSFRSRIRARVRFTQTARCATWNKRNGNRLSPTASTRLRLTPRVWKVTSSWRKLIWSISCLMKQLQTLNKVSFVYYRTRNFLNLKNLSLHNSKFPTLLREKSTRLALSPR